MMEVLVMCRRNLYRSFRPVFHVVIHQTSDTAWNALDSLLLRNIKVLHSVGVQKSCLTSKFERSRVNMIFDFPELLHFLIKEY